MLEANDAETAYPTMGAGGKAGDVELLADKNDKLLVALSWAPPEASEAVDLDCSVLLFDKHGVFIDAAFYNKPVAGFGAVKHSGDSRAVGNGYSHHMEE